MTKSVRAQLNVSMGLLVAVVCTPALHAQQRPSSVVQPPASAKASTPVRQQASNAGGKVQGIVRDDRGQVVGAARVSAVGTTVQVAFSDRSGRYSLALPSGEYVIRAEREGYTSSGRDMVMVRSSTSIERPITMTRQPVTATARPVMVAGVATGPFIPSSVVEPDPEHPHDETAWRLRHIKRPVLRDNGTVVAEAVRAQNFRPHSKGFFDWALTSSARLATSLFTDTNFTGQVNFVTTSAVDSTLGWSQPEGPRNIAYLSLSAPVGAVGDWRVRGAMNTADMSSWVLLGEFTARQTRTHAFELGMAYSTQTYTDPAQVAFASDAAATTRAVGGLYGSDLWRITPGLELSYGLRWDRYSYVAGAPNMLSPRMAGRVHVAGRLSVVSEVAQRMVAPGSTEFLPPSAAGPWLPPERTFSSLSRSGLFRAERVRHVDLGVEQALGRDGVISIRRFLQNVDDQTATIFGLNTGDDALGAAGHYSVASIGAVSIQGWTMKAAGSMSKRVSGSVEYSVGSTEWQPGGSAYRASLVAPSVVRRGSDRLQDVLTSLDIAIPKSETRLSLAYRFDTAFSRSGTDATSPAPGGRFNVQINQALPFQPLRGGHFEVLVAVSNLYRDRRQPGSLFDEILTVAPPTRLLGGVQLRF